MYLQLAARSCETSITLLLSPSPAKAWRARGIHLARWTHSGYPSCEGRGRAVQILKSSLYSDFVHGQRARRRWRRRSKGKAKVTNEAVHASSSYEEEEVSFKAKAMNEVDAGRDRANAGIG